MRKLALLPALLLSATILSGPASSDTLTPYGREDNALGTLRWLPANANAADKPVGANIHRLVVIYDFSITEAGAQIPLKAKGPFGVKMFTTSQADLKMKGHSAKVGDANTLTAQNLPPQVNETVAGVFGDVRDGACSKAGTPAHSFAYRTTRTFFHAGTTPYAPVSGPGICEKVDSTTEVRDAEGALLGFSTTVTNHVPGFWVDVEWLTRAIPQGLGTGYLAAEVWYGAAYDSAGDPGPFPQGVDTTGASKSLGTPGDYTATYAFTGNPGGVGVECVNTGGNGQATPGTFQDVKVQVPTGAKKVTFRLFPKGDWDMVIFNPEGLKRTSGAFGGIHEQSIAPSTTGSGTSGANFPELIPGEWIMRGCNFTGEPNTFGAVIIEM